MNILVSEMIKKQKVLSNWTNEKIEKIDKALSDWENFKDMLEDHQLVMKQQIEMMKNNLIMETQRVLTLFDTFQSRWHQYKPKGFEDESNLKLKKIVDFLKDSRAEWNIIKENSGKVM